MPYGKTKKEQLSKFMTLILRHEPTKFGVVLDEDGQCMVEELIAAIKADGRWEELQASDIEEAVAECEKQRFLLNGEFIKARYGHSHGSIRYPKSEPPEKLIHGTHEGALDGIFEKGVLKMKRRYVHMSESSNFASLAGKRHGKLVLLEVDAKRAWKDGVEFSFAGNEVWLADYIAPKYVSRLEEGK